MYLASLRVGGNGRILLFVDEIQNFVFHLALSHTTDLHHLGADHLRLQLLQIRIYLIHEQRIQLVWRSRKKNGRLAVFLQDQSRRGTIIIVQNDAASRNNGLLPVIVRNHLINVVPEILLNPFMGMRILHQREAHYLRTDLFGQIVLSRSKTAGQDDDIRALQCRPDYLSQAVVVISDCHLVIHGQTQKRAFFCKKLGVGIHNVSEQKLCSD